MVVHGQRDVEGNGEGDAFVHKEKLKAKGGKGKLLKSEKLKEKSGNGGNERSEQGNGFYQSACNDFVGKQFYKVTIFKSICNFRQVPLKKSD
jgi:hypothetical protein